MTPAPHHPTPEADLKAAVERLEHLLADAEADYEDDYADAEEREERPDLWEPAEAVVVCADLRLVLAQLAAYRERIEGLERALRPWASLAGDRRLNTLTGEKSACIETEGGRIRLGFSAPAAIRRAAQALAASKGEG